MPIFSTNSGKFQKISEIPFKLEKDLQKMTEDNLDEIFNLDFTTHEFQLSGLRIDTLGFDKETNSFVIIEYKRDKSFSVIDQGFAYLSLLLNNKAEFLLAYNENNSKPLKKQDIDWSQSKIIFIANSFTSYQKQAIGFKDLPMELYEVKQYSNKTILFNQIQSPEKHESINKLGSKNKTMQSVSREIKTYSEEYHFEKGGNVTISLYKELRDKIQSLGGDVESVYRKNYIAFKTQNNFVYLKFKKNFIHADIVFLPNKIIDPQKLVRDMTRIGHHGYGNSRMTLKNRSEIPYLMSLIEQAYTKLS
jgi:predicted transport protein